MIQLYGTPAVKHVVFVHNWRCGVCAPTSSVTSYYFNWETWQAIVSVHLESKKSKFEECKTQSVGVSVCHKQGSDGEGADSMMGGNEVGATVISA